MHLLLEIEKSLQSIVELKNKLDLKVGGDTCTRHSMNPNYSISLIKVYKSPWPMFGLMALDRCVVAVISMKYNPQQQSSLIVPFVSRATPTNEKQFCHEFQKNLEPWIAKLEKTNVKYNKGTKC